MRFLTVLISAVLLASTMEGETPEHKKHRSDTAKTHPGPQKGVKTPGIQIPFSSLKAEAELPALAKPQWAFFADFLFAPGENGLMRIDTKTNRAADPLAGIDKPCGGMVSAFGSLWVPSCGGASLVRVDPKTFKIIKTIATGTLHAAGIIASSPDSIWLLTDDKTTVSRIDPDQNAVVGEVRIDAGCEGIVYGQGSLWLACPSVNKVLRLNPATNVVDKRIEVSAQPESIALAENSIWVLCGKEGQLDRIDPKTEKVVKTIDLGAPSAGGMVASGEGSLWVTMPDFPLTRINPADESVAQQFFGEGGGALAVSPGAIWLSNTHDGTLWRLDPKRILATLAP